MTLIECVPNVSEGRRADVVAALAQTIRGIEGVRLLDHSADVSHHRSVFTFAGGPAAVRAAVLSLVAEAVRTIDLRQHDGVHPRVGAVDVVPFVPLAGASMGDCVTLARDVGEALGCGAHLTRLIRLWVGSFRLEEAVSLDEIGAAAGAGQLDTVLRSADDALAGLPAVVVPNERLIDIGHGRPWPSTVSDAPAGPTRVYDTGGRLLALAEHDRRRGVWQPRLALVSPPGGHDDDG